MAVALVPVLVEWGMSTFAAEVTAFALSVVASAVVAKLLAPKIPDNNAPLAGNNITVQPATNNKLPVIYGNSFTGGTIVDLSITSDNQTLYYVIALSEVTGNGTDSYTFGDILFGGRRCLFNGYTYTSLGITVASINNNQISYTGTLPSGIVLGSLLTFNNGTAPISYIVSGINTSSNVIQFTVTIDPTVAIGNTIYQFVNGTNTSLVYALQDVSTGQVSYIYTTENIRKGRTTTTTVTGSFLNIYLYSNGSNSGFNTSLSAIQVMQSTGLTYTWDNTKLMKNCCFAIVELTYNTTDGLTGFQQTQFQVINPRNSAGDVIFDYLTSPVYGASIPSSQVDSASIAALNTYCNQTITFNNSQGLALTQPRFKFNGVIDTVDTVLNNIQNISNCCDCLVKYNEIYGLWGVIVQSTSYTVAMDLNDSNMISSLSITSMDISNTYNIAECQFPDLTLNGSFNTSTINLSSVDPSLLYANEPANTQTIKLPLVNNDVQAQLLATRFLKQARLDLQVVCEVNYIGLELEAGDIVTITNANYGWTAKLFEIFKVEQNFASDGAITVSLTLQSYDPNVFADVSITQYTPPSNTGLGNPNVFGVIPAPTISNLKTNSAVPSFQVNITTSAQGIVQYANIYYSAYSNPTLSQLIFAGTTAIASSGSTYGNNTAIPATTISGIPAGNWYFFSQMVNQLATSDFSPASSVLAWTPFTFQFSQRYLSIAYATSATGTGFTYTRSGATYFGLANSGTSTVDSNPADYNWYLASPAFGTTNYLLFNNYGNNLIGFATGGANLAAGSGAFVPSDTNDYDPSVWEALPDGTNLIDLNQRSGQVIQTGTTVVGSGQIAVTNNQQGQVVASLAQLLNFGTGVTTKTSSVATLTIDIYGRVVGFTTPDSFYYSMTAYVASSGQTVFSVTRGSEYSVGNCWVFQNGLILNPSLYTDASGSVTLATGATANDIITIVSFASVSGSTGTYSTFSLNVVTLSNQANYTASGFTLVDGNELLFLNGTIVNAQDYNVSGQVISFIGNATGELLVYQWTNNNLGVPNGNPVSTDIYTIVGQSLYPFSYDPNAFNLWNNGALLLETTDYSVASGTYTLAQTPTTNLNILVQQTFSRTGAV